MPAYIRLIIGDKGKVIKVIQDSLYEPDEELKDFIEELFKWGGSSIDYVDEHISDAEVLIVFRPHSYQCNHPLDPVEYDTEILIEHTIILQYGYKKYWRKKISEELRVATACKGPQDHVQNLIGEWEELYDEDFQPLYELKGVVIDNTQFGLGEQYISFGKTEE
ncbi:hypothetical protein ABE178_15685 [Priestia megaterium]